MTRRILAAALAVFWATVALLAIAIAAPRAAPEFVPPSPGQLSAPPSGAGQAAVLAVTSARDPFNGRESPRHRPALRGAETADGGAPQPAAPHRASDSATASPDALASMPATRSGFATWCAPTPTRCQRWGGDARLGAVPSFRWGDTPYPVRVSYGGRSTIVQVVSFCACGDRHGEPTAIDISPAAFESLAPLSRGVIRVEVQRLDTIALPETGTR